MKRFLIVCVCILAAGEIAYGSGIVKDFYKKKRKSTTKEAYLRAEARLAKARVGMKQQDFFALMEMEILARNKKVYDARVDGYLWVEPKEKPQKPNTRKLVFGYHENGRAVSKILVVFQDDWVSRIERIDQPLIAKKH